MADTIFDNIFVASTLENGVIDLLKKWFPTYLREVERQVSWEREPLKEPADYSTRVQFNVESGEPMPKAIVISPGLYEAPTRGDAGDFYNASWQIAIGVAFAARNEELADMIAKMYGAAVRAMMVQHQSLEMSDNGVKGVFWLDESYDDLQIPSKIELYKASASLFAVGVESVITRWAGPEQPDESAQEDRDFETVDTTIVKYPITADLES